MFDHNCVHALALTLSGKIDGSFALYNTFNFYKSTLKFLPSFPNLISSELNFG